MGRLSSCSRLARPRCWFGIGHSRGLASIPTLPVRSYGRQEHTIMNMENVNSGGLTTVNFHGNDLVALRGDSPETTLVAMKPVVEGMGLDWTYQYRKLAEHPVLSSCVAVTAIQVPGSTQSRDMIFLPLNRLSFWLATIQPSRIKDEAIRALVIEYQTECADVLFDRFFGKALSHAGVPDVRTVGGVMKSVVGKANNDQTEALVQRLAEMLAPEVIKATMTAGHVALTTEFKPSLWILKRQGLTPSMRRGLSTPVTKNLQRWCARYADKFPAPRENPETGVFTFHVDSIQDWLANGGNAFIAECIARKRVKMGGQPNLFIVPRSRGKGTRHE